MNQKMNAEKSVKNNKSLDIFIPHVSEDKLCVSDDMAYIFIENIKYIMIAYDGYINFELFRKHVQQLLNNIHENLFVNEFNQQIDLERDRLKLNGVEGYTINKIPISPLYEDIISESEFVNASLNIHKWGTDMDTDETDTEDETDNA